MFYDPDLQAVILYTAEGSLQLAEANVFFDDSSCEGNAFLNNQPTTIVHVSNSNNTPQHFIPDGELLSPGEEVFSELNQDGCFPNPTLGRLGNVPAREVTDVFDHPSAVRSHFVRSRF